jgi:hypothetical protein
MGGFKLSLGGAKPKAGGKASLPPPAKKARLVLDEEEAEDKNTSVEITGFDVATGGAIDVNGKKEPEGPRVIPSLPNRNWRDAARKKQPAKAEDNVEQYKESELAFGLTVIKKEDKDGDVKMEEAEEQAKPVDDGLTEEQRLEKNALAALLHGKAEDQTVIPARDGEDTYEDDYRNAPEAPSLDAYEATPIEGFGAALLRGMGWKDGEEIGRNKDNAVKPREIKRRPALLGIGAKEEAAVGIELGAWGNNKGKVKGKAKEQAYAPIALRNKKTGEIITEEELKAKLESQKLVGDDPQDEPRRERKDKEKRDRRDMSEERDYKKKDRRRDDDYDSERRREKRRDDDYDSERRKDRRREDDVDEDRRREKRRERERRDRSRSPGSDERRRRDKYEDSKRRDNYADDDRRREKRGDERKYRSGSRDSDDRRKRRRDYDDERDDRKRRHKDDRHYKD